MVVLSDVSLKTRSPCLFFFQYASPLLDNIIKVLSPPFKEKLSMDERLDFSLL